MRAVLNYFAPLWQARSWREHAYLLLGLPLGILGATYALTMYVTGIALAIVWVGLAILVAIQASLRPIGAFERGLLKVILGESVQAPKARAVTLHERGDHPSRSAWGRWLHALVHDLHSWGVLGWIMARLVLGPIGFVVALLAVVMPVVMVSALLLALYVQTGLWAAPVDEPEAVAVVHSVAGQILIVSPLLIAALPMFAWASRGFASLYRALGHRSLGPCREELATAANARAQLAEEQVRIDQELHDSIGHMITMNVVQAGAGAHVFDSDPEFARQALRNIEERGRAAMGELDRIVATIRGDAGEDRAPLPGLGDIGGLIDSARAAGIRVHAKVEPTEVPPALGRTAFGLVREALTNVGKHAPGARVDVTVVRDGDALGIFVINAPVPRAEDTAIHAEHAIAARGTRHGVSGMRDRVALLGGRSEIGVRDDGGFGVLALLPITAQLSPTDDAYARWKSLREGVHA